MKKYRPILSNESLHTEDIELHCNGIIEKLKETVHNQLKRKGGVVGISGGIDSSATLALSVKAFGAENVLGVILPESDSNPDSEKMAKALAKKYGVRVVVEKMTDVLTGFGCYTRRDKAIANVIPDFNPDLDKTKIVIKQKIDKNIPPVFSVTVIKPDGQEENKVLPLKNYLQIVAASNFKQRSRMAMLYYYAECNYYAVIGTPNRHEVEQGFFVKYGDGGADVMPIANLYKTQVFQVAKHLGVPEEIINRTPTTDTYSAEQTQEEFFFQMPFKVMDLILYGVENSYSIKEIAAAVEKSEDDINNILRNLERKRNTTEYLRTSPVYF